MRLFRVDPLAADPLEAIGEELPSDVRGLDAADVDGDGNEDLLLLRVGRIETATGPRFDGTLRPIDESDTDAYGGVPRAVRDPGSATDPFWRIVTVGGLRTYGRDGASGFRLLSEVALRVSVSRRSAGIVVSTSDVEAIGKGADGGQLLATSPEAVGKERLRVSLLSPESPEPRRVTECWAKLPAPERVLDHAFLMLDGRPVLVVATTSSEKLGLFSEKLLRVFALAPDRTRAGAAPLFSCETRMNLWQAAAFHAMDVDGDGRQDLVATYWKGLKHGVAVLDTYLRKPDGGFAASPRAQELSIDREDRSVLEFGQDLDGDGAPDLALVGGGRLLVFPGNREPNGGKALVRATPSLQAPISKETPGESHVTISLGSQGVSGTAEPGRLGRPVPIDLDGDGRKEFLFAGNDPDGRGRVVVLVPRASRTEN
jgi:hypothetical protein